MENTIKTEEQLQAACFQWFDRTYPALRGSLFAVPNGGERTVRGAMALKATGVVAGVSDLILVLIGRVVFIELKFEKGRQSDAQVRFQAMVEKRGHKYYVVNSLWIFQELIKITLNEN